MHNSLRYRNCRKHSGREFAISVQCMVMLAVCVLGVIQPGKVFTQTKSLKAEKSPLCTRDNALGIIKQQGDFSKTFNSTSQRIAVLIRVADLLWPYQQDKARTSFVEAFDLAAEDEKENDRKASPSVVLRMRIPDQRYVVIRAIMKRDSAWARELTREMLKLSAGNGETSSSTRDSFKDLLAAERLLDSATKLITTDINSALDLARVSLNYPASSMLTRFLYRLAEVNQQAADQFYAQALAVYGGRPMREFLYLQAYPFAWRDTVNTPIFASYVVPANFVTNQSLQRRFLQSMLNRAQQTLEVPLDEGDTYRNPRGAVTPGTVHLLNGLMLLEPQVRASLPEMSPSLTEAREKILVSLSVDTQKLLIQPGREVSTTPEQTFSEQIEAAQKAPDVSRRDNLITMTVLSAASDKQGLADVVDAIEKISDSKLRASLLEWLYFRRAVAAAHDKQFEEAERLASRVEGLEQRAFLHIEIAKGLLKSGIDTHTSAREVLEKAIAEAGRARASIFTARTLLTASSLFAKIDLSRSIAVLTDAINCINRIEAPDFSSDDQTLVKLVDRTGQSGSQYPLRFHMPGLEPEGAFREMAKIDFDTALSQSSALADKFQRAMATLALTEPCLQQAQPLPKEKPKKAARP